LWEHGWFFAPHSREVGRTVLCRTFLESTLHPVPRQFHHDELTIVLVGIPGMLEPPDVLQFPLGGRPAWRVAETGFHHQETLGGQPVRWTNGHGKLLIPIGDRQPDEVVIDLAQTPPKGSPLRVLANGHELYQGFL